MKRLQTIRVSGLGASRLRALILVTAFSAASCDPIVNVAGANFPAWLLCAIAGGIGLPALRALLLQLGLEPYLWWAPGVYTAAAILLACVVWIAFFNRI